MNYAAPPLDKKEFRLALNYAANREAILKNVFFGIGDISQQLYAKNEFLEQGCPAHPL